MNQLTESVNHTITRLPTALPVVVIEAIPSDLSLISTNILENGWAILVCGRRLFAWNYSQTSSVIKTCYELQLPASDISHKADLVCLLFANDKHSSNSIPAVLAVSPEGTIRFWPKIANSNNNIEVVAHELQGQECNSLVNLKPFGCILSTTTNTLMQVNINYGGTSLNDSNMITCRLLKMPQGVFAGFKKFSSFIFGGTNSQYNFDGKNYLVKVLQGRKHSDHSEIIVLSGNVMQLFEISYNSDKLLTEIDLDRLLKEGVLRLVLINGATQIDQLNLWIIDAKYKSNNEIVVIFACFIKNISVYMNYVLATLTPESSQNGSTIQIRYMVKSMNLLRNYTSPVEQDDNNQSDHSLLNLRLVKETAFAQLHYIYDRNKVTCVQEGNDIVDTIFFNNPENEILGIGVWEERPLVFTSKDSLITLTPSEELVSLNSSTNLQITETDLNESDKYYWLKKAFQTYRKKDLQLSQQLIKDNFLGDLTLDFELDKNVILMCEELIDSTPNSDPRWPQLSQNVNYNVVSVLISNQIEEKYRNFIDLIGFLKHCGIWEKLTIVNLESKSVPTKLLLCENGEKLVAANALKKLEEEFHDQIDHVIRTIVERRNISMDNNLTNHDYFYRQVSSIYHFFPALYNYEEDYLNTNNLNSKEMLEFIVSCSLILIIVFQDVSYFRKNQTFFQEALNEARNYPEYNLWTNTAGVKKGIRTTLLKQIDLLISYGIESKFKPGTMSIDEDIRVRTMLYQKLIDITDIVLEGHQYQMQIVKPDGDRFKVIRKDFENDRSRCIKPLIKVKQYERAMSLAEKYEDFDTLITICEILNNNDRLNKYRIEFQEKGFAEHLFKWYMAQGKQSKMLVNTSPFLGKFLENHENLYWLYAIQNNQFDKAGDCLQTLGKSEEKLLDRKKTLYSLSKLSFLAYGLPDNDELIGSINREHEIIAFQEILPEYLLPKDSRPLSPIEMIEILTNPENDKLTEIEFKHALDLTIYVKENVHKHESVKRLVIANAILRDRWNSFSKDDPLAYITDTLFYKLVKHAFLSGDNIAFLIPTCDDLLSWSEFETLENKNSFIYLIKVLYENYINKFMQ